MDFINLIATLILAIFLSRQRKKYTFEVKIISCMSLSYLIWTLNHIDCSFNGKKVFTSFSDPVFVFFFALASTCYCFAYWTYASQYLKTIKILPSLLKKAHLLFTQYKEKVENEYEMNALTEDFFVRHDEIDTALMLIKKRVKIVN